MTKPFGRLKFVAAAAFGMDSAYTGDLYFRQWQADTTVIAKKFRRRVKAGGAAVEVTMIVVRRREANTEETGK